MLFEVHTVYDPDTVRALKDTISGRGRSSRQASARRGVLIAGGVCLAAAAVLFWGLHNDVAGILLLVCGIILLCIGASLDRFLDRRRKKEEKKETKQAVSESVSVFDETSFTVRNEKGEKTYPYAACQKLLENDSHFILMVGDWHAVALDKAGFVTGEAESFRTFLQEASGKVWNS